MADQGHHSPGGYIETDAFENVAADRLVSETDILKGHRHL
jgi:hypothetical protein